MHCYLDAGEIVVFCSPSDNTVFVTAPHLAVSYATLDNTSIPLSHFTRNIKYVNSGQLFSNLGT